MSSSLESVEVSLPPMPLTVQAVYRADTASDFLKIEMQSSTLKRLIGEKSLVVEELRCPTQEAKALVRQSLLDSLKTN